MTRRGTSAPSKDDTNIKRVIKELQKRSAKSLRMAKDTVLRMKVESREINEAIKHYIRSWSDYVHPGLMSIACEAVGGNPDEAVPIQVVMLILTAAADIHDDIIDESKIKYRKPTVFGKFSKDIALLVGDAFLLRGITFLNEIKNQIPEAKANAVWNIIFSRFFELGDAEAIEVSVRGNIDVSPEEYLRILERKASIFEAYMRIGALIGGGDQDAVDVLGNYGKTLGILLSIREDVIDTFEPGELQNRMKNECLPLPILYAFKNPLIRKTILNYLSKPKISNKDAERIVDIVFDEKNVEMLKNKIEDIVEKASENIAVLENEKLKSQLNTLTRAIVDEL
jgi:geranylgeranyl diphosphate synthase type I